MVQLSILYPKKDEGTFDWNYYLTVHMPLSIKLHGDALKKVTITKAIEGVPEVPFSYVAITNFLFESVNDFIEAFTPHAEILQGDMKNYTNIQPVIQFSEVVLPG